MPEPLARSHSSGVRAGRLGAFAMQTSLVIALTVAFVLAGGSALAVMNKSCKSGRGPWCAPVRTHCSRFWIGAAAVVAAIAAVLLRHTAAHS